VTALGYLRDMKDSPLATHGLYVSIVNKLVAEGYATRCSIDIPKEVWIGGKAQALEITDKGKKAIVDPDK
jgi:hypothetical protein